MQPVGRMRKKIALATSSSDGPHVAPERGKSFLKAGRSIDDDEFWRLQAAIDQIVEEHPPRGFALSCS